MDGGEGWDVASYMSTTGGVTVDLTRNVNSGAASGDKILSIEVLQGSNFADMLTSVDRGCSGAQLYGEGGHDTLLGRGGGDQVHRDRQPSAAQRRQLPDPVRQRLGSGSA
jgi:hypothetical protein